jgi:ABC-2 type transport system permease protein
LAKYFAALLVVAVSLCFCVIYYLSVYYLGSPVGSIDSGAFWGSFIGLFFLAAVYVAIGVFAGSLTDNQIIAFLFSLVLCFLFYTGFDYLAELNLFQTIQSDIYSLGIKDHYKSISRGVVDSRDLAYFISVIVVFLLVTNTILKSRKW